MPASADEIIITRQIADKFDLKIGDTATIKTPRGDKTMLVVAYMEVMNNLGEVIRFHTDFEGDPESITKFLNKLIFLI